ncbi:hypothetical protein M569_01111 [Genlisea aurea]|uniref:MADS-box domain-containing protein n=1 Tax=Genlisea aurea TaxID=192259 RepID=S8D2M1_9LAMI|nr:hypothetical protein M569_01111 [Genlisea aurea]
MGRTKVRMELITNQKSRIKAYEKRKKGLEKGAHELSTLCGVDIAMILYGPLGGEGETTTNIWPKEGEDSQVLSNLIQAYNLSAPHVDSRYRTYNLTSFYKDQTDSINEEMKRLRKKNRDAMYLQWDDKTIRSLSAQDLQKFSATLAAKIDAVKGKIDMMKATRILMAQQKQQQQQQQSMIVMNPPPRLMVEPENVVSFSNMWKFQETTTNQVHPQPQPPFLYHYDPNIRADQMAMITINNGSSSINNFIREWF